MSLQISLDYERQTHDVAWPRSLNLLCKTGVGHNVLWNAVGPDRSSWVVKFSRNTKRQTPEVCEREILASRIGAHLSLPVVKSNVGILKNPLPYDDRDPDSPLILTKAVVTPYISGHSFLDKPMAAAFHLPRMIAKIAGLLVFSFWIGDEDRGISDLIFHDDELVSLDYGLCFPRDVSAGFLKGYHPHVRDYRNVNRLKKCYYQKRSLTAFLFRDCLLDPYSFVNHETLYAIERIDSHWLEQTVESAGLSSAIAFTLAERARTLRNDYVDWIGALARYFEGVGSANGDDSRFE